MKKGVVRRGAGQRGCQIVRTHYIKGKHVTKTPQEFASVGTGCCGPFLFYFPMYVFFLFGD